jgi:hypothetical protein
MTAPRLLLFLFLFTFQVHATTPPASADCKAAYNDLFSKSVVNIWMVFGYKDIRPARFVGDRHERLAFVQKILSDCAKGNFACGFKRDNKNADLFTRKIKSLKKKSVTVQLWVINSSVGSDDQSNRMNPFQVWQSSYAKKSFDGAIASADVAFYNGHSRFGAGPDFAPPHIDDKEQVDSVYYQNQKLGFSDILEALGKRTEEKKPALKILGLFSCSSSQHFSNEIKNYASVGLISGKSLIFYSDALENSLTSLSSILQMRCKEGINKALGDGKGAKGMTIEGFAP